MEGITPLLGQVDNQAAFLAFVIVSAPVVVGLIAFVHFCRRVIQLLKEISAKLDDRFDELVEAVDDGAPTSVS